MQLIKEKQVSPIESEVLARISIIRPILTSLLIGIKATPQNTQKKKPCGKIPSGRAYVRQSISDAGAQIQAVRQDRLSARIRFAGTIPNFV